MVAGSMAERARWPPRRAARFAPNVGVGGEARFARRNRRSPTVEFPLRRALRPVAGWDAHAVGCAAIGGLI